MCRDVLGGVLSARLAWKHIRKQVHKTAETVYGLFVDSLGAVLEELPGRRPPDSRIDISSHIRRVVIVLFLFGRYIVVALLSCLGGVSYDFRCHFLKL